MRKLTSPDAMYGFIVILANLLPNILKEDEYGQFFDDLKKITIQIMKNNKDIDKILGNSDLYES